MNKGITLVALIITIIILLILAGVAVNIAINNGGLFEKTQEATGLHGQASINEQTELGKVEDEIDKWLNGGSFEGYDEEKGVNTPILKGMQPVRWTNDTNIATVQNTTEDSADWYEYVAGNNSTDTKTSHWANAKTNDGSYFVWIPRYAYKITEKPAHANPQTESGKIEVVFLKGTTNQYNDNGTMKDAVANGYIIHPAFTFGETQLTGFWVGKYESSNSSGNIKIESGVSSWRNINVSTIFENCYTMASNPVYGWNVVQNGDTHMIKNVEWGATAYLTHSQYGRNRNEISPNTNSSYIAGIAGIDSSTTGNTYGIYDMSGGAYEYVAGNLTGFLGNAGSQANFDTIYGGALKDKFFDIYDYSGTSGTTGREPNYQVNSGKTGDALYETSTAVTESSSWFSDSSSFVSSDNPWFVRGGDCSGGEDAGVFYFYNYARWCVRQP